MNRRLATALIATMLAGFGAQQVAAQTVTPLDTLRIVDQNGRSLGRAFSGASGFFFLKARDVYVRIGVSRDQFVGSDNVLYYESSDCSGQPLLQVDPATLVGFGPSHVGSLPDQTLTTPREGATLTSTIVRSDRATGRPCHVRAEFTINAVPGDPFIDLGPLYTPPFRVAEVTEPGAGCCGDCDGNGEVAINELLTGVGSALDGCTAK